MRIILRDGADGADGANCAGRFIGIPRYRAIDGTRRVTNESSVSLSRSRDDSPSDLDQTARKCQLTSPGVRDCPAPALPHEQQSSTRGDVIAHVRFRARPCALGRANLMSTWGTSSSWQGVTTMARQFSCCQCGSVSNSTGIDRYQSLSWCPTASLSALLASQNRRFSAAN